MSFLKIKAEFERISERHTQLKLSSSKKLLLIEGLLGFVADVKGEEFRDEYEIRICITDKYPEELPDVFETGSRIANTPENHVNETGTLCVGRPPEIREVLAPIYSITDYIEKILIGYLSQYSYKERYGVWPYGETEHGVRGIWDYYKEKYPKYFDTDEKVIKALLDLSKMKIRPKGYKRCSCGCGKLIKNCKYQKMLKKVRKKEEEYASYIEKFKKEEQEG